MLVKNGIPIHTLDLNFLGIPNTIAAYFIPHSHGGVLVECGPGSTIPTLQSALSQLGYTIEDITDVLLTHIHLDHAGAAGWMARQGARVHVHPVGAPHLLDPSKLLASAKRIYEESMDQLWGEFLPVPEGNLVIINEGEIIEIDKLRFTPLDTPGHAYHHMAFLMDGVCFTGDVGGVRVPGPRQLRLPTPPPEFHLVRWLESLKRLENQDISHIAPTHFGIYSDPDWHIQALADALESLSNWMEAVIPTSYSRDDFHDLFLGWINKQAVHAGIPHELMGAYETAIPSWMSADGIMRYWRKHRLSEETPS